MKNYTEYQMYVLEKYNVDCIDLVKLLGDYHEGDLSDSLNLKLKEHVDECVYCQDLEDSYRLVVEIAKSLKSKEKPMSSGVKVRLRQALNQKLGINLRTE